MARTWNTGVVHSCDGFIEAWVEYLKPGKYVIYNYRCLRCKETGDWKQLVKRMGKTGYESNKPSYKKNKYSKKS